MLPDWIDHYIDGTNSKAVEIIKKKSGEFDDLHQLLKKIIRECSNVNQELNEGSFSKLKIIVVNEYGFKYMKDNSGVQYVIYIPQSAALENEKLFKHKIAHEIAHFLFSITGTHFNNFSEEEKACNEKAAKWGFTNPAKNNNDK